MTAKVCRVIAVVFALSLRCFCDDNLSEAVKFMSAGRYHDAVKVLHRVKRTPENERTLNYYLCESYFMLKDFLNSLKFGEEVIKIKNDFIYKKSLYNVVFSSYILNDFEKSYSYGMEYLSNVGDTQGVESSVLTITFSSLQSLGEIEKARELVTKYQYKYPSLSSSLLKALEKTKLKNLSKTEKRADIAETDAGEKLKIYSEMVREILNLLDKISSDKDKDMERLKDIIEILELKEEALKIKKYRMLME